jgi:hypothetical protein
LLKGVYMKAKDTPVAARLIQDFPGAAVNALGDIKRKFTNQRQWREFVSAVQCSAHYPAAVYPAAVNALRSGKKWFSDGLAQASGLAPTLRAAQSR